MCSAANAGIVQEVIDEFLANQMSFTAYDVTVEAKKRGADEEHYHLKQEVHGQFRNGAFQAIGYVRSLINVASPQPFLYHPASSDPQDYEDKVLNGQSNASPTDGVQTTPTSTATLDTVKRTADAAGRLCLPKGFLAEINATPGSVIECSEDDGKLVVCKATPQSTKSYVVNTDGRVRVSKEVLSETVGTFGDPGEEFEITLDSDANQILVDVA